MFNEFETEAFHIILDVLSKGLRFLQENNKLSDKEGEVKLIYNENRDEYGIEIYAPHLIPNALSHSWISSNYLKAFEQCIRDLTLWIDDEKNAPQETLALDFAREFL